MWDRDQSVHVGSGRRSPPLLSRPPARPSPRLVVLVRETKAGPKTLTPVKCPMPTKASNQSPGPASECVTEAVSYSEEIIYWHRYFQKHGWKGSDPTAQVGLRVGIDKAGSLQRPVKEAEPVYLRIRLFPNQSGPSIWGREADFLGTEFNKHQYFLGEEAEHFRGQEGAQNPILWALHNGNKHLHLHLLWAPPHKNTSNNTPKTASSMIFPPIPSPGKMRVKKKNVQCSEHEFSTLWTKRHNGRHAVPSVCAMLHHKEKNI